MIRGIADPVQQAPLLELLERPGPDLRRPSFAGPAEESERITREKLWLLMLLAHEAGGDAYDPRLAFLHQAEHGLTRGAIETRMWIAFGITRELAGALIGLALEVGCLRADTVRADTVRGHRDHHDRLYLPVGATAAVLTLREALPA